MLKTNKQITTMMMTFGRFLTPYFKYNIYQSILFTYYNVSFPFRIVLLYRRHSLTTLML